MKPRGKSYQPDRENKPLCRVISNECDLNEKLYINTQETAFRLKSGIKGMIKAACKRTKRIQGLVSNSEREECKRDERM